jgi:hypothetical protein
MINLLLTLPFLIPIAIISIDHAYRHDGKFLDFNDFKMATLSCLKSHEGWIFMIIMVLVGYIIGAVI